MVKISILLTTSAIFACCESAAIVDKVNKKCDITDNECLPQLYRGLLKEIADNGIPEMDIPRIDPIEINDIELLFLGMLKITVTKGAAKGFKNCYVTSFKNEIENLRTSIELVCDVFSMDGNYRIESSPTLLALIGRINVHGEGKGGFVAEKLKLNFKFAFEIQKLDDGELHIIMKPVDSLHTFEIMGKLTIFADNVLVGKQEISAVAVNILNENWKFISATFGKTFVDKALDVFYVNAQKFFNHVPAKDLFTTDLSPFVKS